MNTTIDSDGVLRERLISLNRQKSGALAAVTAKRNEIERLMKNVDNFLQVQSEAAVLTDLFEKYINTQKKLLSEMKDDEDNKLKAIRDFNETIQRGCL